MKLQDRCNGILVAIPLLLCAAPASAALEMLYGVDAPEYSQLLEDASGLRITDDGVV